MPEKRLLFTRLILTPASRTTSPTAYDITNCRAAVVAFPGKTALPQHWNCEKRVG